jgi:hypothetical protein
LAARVFVSFGTISSRTKIGQSVRLGREIEVRSPATAADFSLLHSVQTNSEIHIAFSLLDIKGYFTKG